MLIDSLATGTRRERTAEPNQLDRFKREAPSMFEDVAGVCARKSRRGRQRCEPLHDSRWAVDGCFLVAPHKNAGRDAGGT
jgi:hypothetical protein